MRGEIGEPVAQDDDDLKINTLYALSKYSPGLVLEEHGHCEVPAGCGGVVLRWRDPAAGTPAVLSVACKGNVRAWLDDVEIPTGYLALRPGRRVLTLELRELSEVPSPVLVALRAQQGEAVFYASSAEARSAVGAAWQSRPLDAPEAPFVPMSSADDLLPAPRQQDWRFRRLTDLGARALRADGAAILVRFVFDHREQP